MEGIWTGLKRANARAVFAGSVAGLVLVIGWWTWRLLTPVAVLTPAVAPAPAESVSSGLGLLDILSRQRVTFTNQTARNPFLLPEGTTSPRTRTAAAKSAPRPAAATSTVAEVKTAATPPPKREMLRLTYHGALRRSDGTVTALIEDSRSRRSSFYPAGTNVLGLRLEQVAPGEITVLQGKDRPTVIKRGVTATFEEESNHDN